MLHDVKNAIDYITSLYKLEQSSELKGDPKNPHIYLNDEPVYLGRTLEETSDSLNAKSVKTGIKVEIRNAENGSKELSFTSSKKEIILKDPNNL